MDQVRSGNFTTLLQMLSTCFQGRYTATWKRKLKFSWREAGPPNHLEDKVNLDQLVVNEEPSLSCPPASLIGIWGLGFQGEG